MTLAGYGLSGTPLTCKPAAQRTPASTSESNPPHLPSTRTGNSHVLQVTPVTPTPLFESAPTIPDTRVPCQELSDTSQPSNSGVSASAAVTQSPGSEGSESRPLPSLAVRNVLPPASAEIKS